jgi:K+ transporter
VRSSSSDANGVTPTAENVLGVRSLMNWSLTLVVAVKYLGWKVLFRRVVELGMQIDL